MAITIVMQDGKTLYAPQINQQQLDQLRQFLSVGHGVFEFSQDERSYLVNVARILYIEVVAGA